VGRLGKPLTLEKDIRNDLMNHDQRPLATEKLLILERQMDCSATDLGWSTFAGIPWKIYTNTLNLFSGQFQNTSGSILHLIKSRCWLLIGF
jgi:hypothetical protein